MDKPMCGLYLQRMLQASCPVCVRSIQLEHTIIIAKSKRILASRKTRKSRHQWQLLTTGFAEGYDVG